jgi:RecA-family ATPase
MTLSPSDIGPIDDGQAFVQRVTPLLNMREEPSRNPETEASIAKEAHDIAQRIIAAPAPANDPDLPRQWIVADLIPDANLTLLTGEGGVGKSTLATQLAAAMQIDCEWLGMRVTQGGVLFVSTEDERKDIKFSLSAILKAENKSVARCSELHILSLADRDACLATAPAKFAAIEATPLWHALDREIDRLAPRLVVFDALADLFGGEENARRHVRGFIVLLKRLAIMKKFAVILVAHPPQRREFGQRLERLNRLAQWPARQALFPETEGCRRSDTRPRRSGTGREEVAILGSRGHGVSPPPARRPICLRREDRRQRSP